MNLTSFCIPKPRDMRATGLLGFIAFAAMLLAACNATKLGSTTAPTPAATGTLSASSSSLSFGNVAVGRSKSISLTLSNSGSQSATFQVSQVSISGTAFRANGPTPPITLAAGQTVVLNVAFQPSAGGAVSGSLSIASTASNPLLTLPLSGTGLAPGQVGVSPASMSFGNVTVGNSQIFAGSLSAGSAGVTVSSATWSGSGFSLSGLSFPVTLQAGQSVPFTVTFAPQTQGTATGSVSFLSNASNSPSTESWTGTGVQVVQHSVALSWNPDTSGVQGYYVYRGGQSGGPYNKISSLLPGTSYTDVNVISAQTYYYVVTALGTNSVESGYSNEAVAAIP